MDQTQKKEAAAVLDSCRSSGATKKMKKDDDESLNRGKKRCDLVSFWELPEYMKDNEFILSYYRADWPLKKALFSVFRWHNETLNVWT